MEAKTGKSRLYCSATAIKNLSRYLVNNSSDQEAVNLKGFNLSEAYSLEQMFT